MSKSCAEINVALREAIAGVAQDKLKGRQCAMDRRRRHLQLKAN